MEAGLTIVLLILVLLFYLSNPHNKTNKWCSLAGLFFWLGAAKEAVLYRVIPLLHNPAAMQTLFMPTYSVCTWALYSLAMPTTLIFALHFNDMDKTRPKRLRLLKAALYLPALILSFVFPPPDFRAYQTGSLPFWIVFAIYNLGAAAVFACLMVRGVRIERPGRTKEQKRQVRLVVLPPVLFWATSVFLTHPFGIQSLFKLWEINVLFLLAGVLVFIAMAFRNGVMGLRLFGETYNWTSDMSLVSKGAAYTSHFLKNQTAKMEWCIENLKAQHAAADLPEEFAILSRSIASVKSYVEEMKRHSENITLIEAPHRLRDLLDVALSFSLKTPDSRITAHVSLPDTVSWVCDKKHMTEVFVNLVSNAVEATRGTDAIEISGRFGRGGRIYRLSFTDRGSGMQADEMKNMFLPFFTTKNTEKNFGLGLTYCKNVVEKHGGIIKAASEPNRGTTVTICLPAKRVLIHDGGEAEETACLE